MAAPPGLDARGSGAPPLAGLRSQPPPLAAPHHRRAELRPLGQLSISVCDKSVEELTFADLHSNFLKVAILTFWFNLPSSNRVERQRRGARGISPRLT